jgi:hypothetical protein
MVVARVAKATNRKLHDPELHASIHSALSNAEIRAFGTEVDRNGNIIRKYCEIPPGLWRQMSVLQFQEDYKRPLFLYRPSGKQHLREERYFTSIMIPVKDIDDWVGRRAAERQQSVIGNERRCEKWLHDLASSEKLFEPVPETQRLSPKQHWRDMALTEFPGLSKRQFERAWGTIAKDFPRMSAPGRKAKSR